MENEKRWEVRKEENTWSSYDDSRRSRDKVRTLILYDGFCLEHEVSKTTTKTMKMGYYGNIVWWIGWFPWLWWKEWTWWCWKKKDKQPSV